MGGAVSNCEKRLHDTKEASDVRTQFICKNAWVICMGRSDV